MLRDAFNNFMKYAKLLKAETGIQYDAKPYKETIKKMLDGYCKAMDEGDEHMKSLYISGLMVRHWDKVKNLIAKCPNIGLDEEDFVGWLYEAIMLACEYRKWQKDPNINAQQCINQCIETIRVRHYYEFNLDKHRANYNAVSLSNPVGDEGDNGLQKTLEYTISDESSDDEVKMTDGSSNARGIVQSFINKKKLVEAIILDVIAFGDTNKTTKQTKKGVDEEGNTYKYASYKHEFWAFKCVQLLMNLPEDYVDYFFSNYDVVPEQFNAALEALRRANSTKLYKELRQTLNHARANLSLSM